MKQVLTCRNALLFAIGCCLPLAGALAGPSSTPGYVKDTSGSVVMDSAGDCVRSVGGFADAADCGGMAAAVEEVTRQAPPAAVHASTMVQLTDKGDVLFDFDKASLNAGADRTLEGLMSKIGEFDKIDSITITGHTDSIGSDSYNQGLSERRAATIRDYLSAKGVNAAVLSSSGMGEAKPIADNATREGRAQNRRVDIVINGEVKQ